MSRSESDGAPVRLIRPLTAAGLPRGRCRSFCFLEEETRRWTVFLVTYVREDGQWRGYFSFRSADYDAGDAELRTADLFVETTEAGVDVRARALGRPLLQALLQSALHTHERRLGSSQDYRRWFRQMLATRATQLHAEAVPATRLSYEQLRSRYESYRMDQVAHLIALIDPAEFRILVDRLLAGREIDFHARDRFQLAMIVVQEMERRLPLPPFELWAEDYLAHADEYHRYTHSLHSGSGDLP